MKRFLITVVLILVVYFLTLRILGQVETFGFFSASLILSGIDRGTTEERVVEFIRENLSPEAATNFDPNSLEVDTTLTDINHDALKDLLMVFKSEETCGTGGCLSTIFIQNELRELEPISFLYAVKSIEPLDSYTENMRDLRINGSDKTRMIWNGATYVLEENM